MRHTVRAAAAATAVATLVVAFAPSVLAADRDVAIVGFAFSPAALTVAAGDTVIWTNKDGVAHTATADDGSFDTGSIAGGNSTSVTFATTGTFAYHCTIHSSMTATIVVQDAAGAAPKDGTAPETDTAAGIERAAPAPAATILLAVVAAASVLGFGAWFARRRAESRAARAARAVRS